MVGDSGVNCCDDQEHGQDGANDDHLQEHGEGGVDYCDDQEHGQHGADDDHLQEHGEGGARVQASEGGPVQ